MISCYLQGGLGNYLFQIAATVSLANENNDTPIFSDTDLYYLHRNFSTYKNNIFSKIKFISGPFPRANVYHEPCFQYREIPYSENLLLIGHFQSEKYFKHVNMNDLLEPTDEIKNYVKTKYTSILNQTTCSIHVRRGDYLKYPNHHPACDISYYNNAISKMPNGTKFLVFSDDIQWCKDKFIGDFEFIEGEQDVIDLYLMSLCNHNIIANSTFSWWGAWLNQNKNKLVIAPKIWFGPGKGDVNTNDILPENWVKI